MQATIHPPQVASREVASSLCQNATDGPNSAAAWEMCSVRHFKRDGGGGDVLQLGGAWTRRWMV